LKIEAGLLNIGYMDELARKNNFLCNLDPRAKLITAIIFIASVVSFDKYKISALIPFFIYPITLIAVGDLPARYLLKKILIASPFAIMVGIFNPIFDKQILIEIAGLNISGGWISYLSIMIRFFLTVSAALILISTTGFNSVCLALEKLKTPKPFVLQLMFLYRYIFLLVNEAMRMIRAISLRSFGKRTLTIKMFTQLLGRLLLRCADRANRIHLAMLSRGFNGSVKLIQNKKIGFSEIFFILGWCAFFIFVRFYNISTNLGILTKNFFK